MVILETLIILSILIVIHEFGHYLAAKILGIEVTTFSLGFGPKFLKKKIWNTEFALSLIPFGGYVQMAGSEPREEEDYGPHEFLSRSKLQRSFVVTAGPLFNVIFGFLIFLIAYAGFGVTVPKGNKIESVENNSLSEKLGIRAGDKILEVDGIPFKTWYHLDIALSRKGPHTLKILRDSDTLNFSWTEKDTLPLGIVPWIPPEVGGVLKGSPAEKAGLKPGDRFVLVENQEVNSWEDLVTIIRKHPGDTLRITWEREGKLLRGIIVPEKTKEQGQDSVVIVGKIGISAPAQRVKLCVTEATILSAEKTWFYTKMTVVLIYRLIVGKVSLKAIGGPVMIGKLIGETSSYGISSLLVLMGLISINLFVINLFPFPVLDGGHLFLYSVEAIRRKSLSRRFQEIYQQIGFVVLILLMLFITFMDILRITGH